MKTEATIVGDQITFHGCKACGETKELLPTRTPCIFACPNCKQAYWIYLSKFEPSDVIPTGPSLQLTIESADPNIKERVSLERGNHGEGG